MSPRDPDSVTTLRSKRRPGEQPKLSDDSADEVTIPEKKPSKWRLNALGLALLLTLAASVAISLALWTRLSRAREEIAATEAAESAARMKQERRMAEEAQTAAPAPPPAEVPVEKAPQRLVLLLTVGTQHYAEKQLRLLQPKCPQAKLTVYRQRKGRCGWSACFAVAAREEDEEKARNCGETRGQALRDAQDFVAVR